MDASAITETITHGPVTPIHTHKPNFGRYVAGCPKCAVKFPEGPPAKAKRKERTVAAPAPAPAPAGITFEQMMELLRAQSTQGGITTEQLIQFAEALKKPSLEEQARMDADRERQIQNRKQNAEAARVEIEQKALHQSRCNHKMERGENAVFGQAHSDGMFHPICVRCLKEFPPVKLSAEQMMMGVS